MLIQGKQLSWNVEVEGKKERHLPIVLFLLIFISSRVKEEEYWFPWPCWWSQLTFCSPEFRSSRITSIGIRECCSHRVNEPWNDMKLTNHHMIIHGPRILPCFMSPWKYHYHDNVAVHVCVNSKDLNPMSLVCSICLANIHFCPVISHLLYLKGKLRYLEVII